MSKDPTLHRLRELSWRRKLTAAEEAELRAWLDAHPELRAEWGAEAGLNEALARLPDVPVASNFTARVMKAVEREAGGAASLPALRWRAWWWRARWLSRAAFAAFVLSGGLFSYHQVQAARRTEMIRSVAVVADIPSLPPPEILENFDAIRALNRTPPADEDLLILLK